MINKLFPFRQDIRCPLFQHLKNNSLCSCNFSSTFSRAYRDLHNNHMAYSPMGAKAWQDASYKTIQLAHDLKLSPGPVANGQWASRTNNGTNQIKGNRKDLTTPPPFQKELISEACNTFARDYMRDAQNSLYSLRLALLETNRHMHKLQRERDALLRCHANIRKDIVTNRETAALRGIRPKGERYPDKVDPLLQEEKESLAHMKKHTERQLQEIGRQLQVLQKQRKMLTEYSKERSQVLTIMSDNARPPLKLKNSAFINVPSHAKEECNTVVKNAHVMSERLKNTQPTDWQKPADQDRWYLKDSITKALLKKANETACIKDDVTLTLGDIRNFVNKQKQHLDEVKISLLLQKGPECSQDLSLRERLDRPLVKNLQKHPETQLPEAALILEGASCLQKSFERAHERVGRLENTRQNLQSDLENKRWGERLDRAAARLRERSEKYRGERLIIRSLKN
ncbi:coiled-coil domain-containing protein 105 [Bombina bombina]|uniref:coiled-coil domain-containing protein 105 n=1 Tax=Bombina bombina TaxID=8345 RepID=UPI00235AB787|nr:coiled-coil domain-containing protein 105 [Bombina bombina]